MIYKKMAGIRRCRELAGLSVYAAAAALGVTKQAWYMWERGDMVPSAAYLPAMAELLQCSIEDLYRETPSGEG